MGYRLLIQALHPLSLVLGLGVLSLLARRLGRGGWATRLQAGSLAVLWLGATPSISESLVARLEGRFSPTTAKDAPQAEAIVVLGGGVGSRRAPGKAIELGDSADRILHASRLFRAQKAPLIVASGGSGPRNEAPRAESLDMAALLEEWGVPSSAILREEESLTTRQNAIETERLLLARGVRRIILVTSALHMPRALGAFRKTTLQPIPSPSSFTVRDEGRPWTERWLPTAAALGRSTSAVHEWLGLEYYALRGWLG